AASWPSRCAGSNTEGGGVRAAPTSPARWPPSSRPRSPPPPPRSTWWCPCPSRRAACAGAASRRRRRSPRSPARGTARPWRLRPDPDRALAGELHARLVAQSIDLSADGLAPLRAAARRSGVTLVVGLHERDGEFSRATLYNTVAIIGPGGDVLNRHRKLVP